MWDAVIINETDNQPLLNATLHLAPSSGQITVNVSWSLSDDGVLTIRLQNRSSERRYYGESFGLFRRSTQGGWESVPDGRSWIMIAHELAEGDEVTLQLDLTPLPLESGTYKLVKDGIEVSFRLITAPKNA